MAKGKYRQKFDDAMNGIKRCNTGCGAEASGQPVKSQSGGYIYLCLDHKKGSGIRPRVNVLAQEERIKDREQDLYEDRAARARVKNREEHERGQGTVW